MSTGNVSRLCSAGTSVGGEIRNSWCELWYVYFHLPEHIGTPERDILWHRLLYTWIGHEIFGTAIRVVIAVDDGCETYLSRAENMKL